MACAQAYPARPIRFIVPFPPPSPTDTGMRLYAQKLSEGWNQSAVVENHGGATGTIGTEMVVKAAPDGYTLLFTVDLPITMAPLLFKVPYDPQRDLIPIAAVMESQNVLMVNASSGIHSLAELTAAAKAKPGRLTFASAGIGSPAHLCGEMIARQAGIDMIHVPYTGAGPAMNAVLAGDVTMFCGPIAVSLAHIRAGTVVALGVGGLQPSPLLPGVAILSSTYPGLTMSNWFGLLAPAGTPAAVVAKLTDAFKAIAADTALQQKLTSIGLEPEWLPGEAFAKRIAGDFGKFREFMTAANIRPEAQ
jgi:tripartite-type tricarboxylate transporter receptor subunit TctC